VALRNAVARPVEQLPGWRWRRARLAAESFRGRLVDLLAARTGRFRGIALDRLLSPELIDSINGRDPRSELMDAIWSELDGPETSEKMMAADAQLYLPDQLLVKMDIASMAHGLEIRAPFLDTDLMARVATMPEHVKLDGARHKSVLVDSISELPASFFARRKQGFSPPVEQWITGKARTYVRDLLLDPVTERRGILRRSTVEDLLTNMDHYPDIAHDMYLMVVFEVWARTCLDNVRETAPRAEFEWTETHNPPAASPHALKSSSLNM
jgi:asparagine synthase (glutamine-hydrolysing)